MSVLSPRRLVALTAASLLGAPLLASTPAQAADPVVINLVDFNDFHGRIDSSTLQWAGTIKQLEAETPAANTLLLSAGDNIGASLFNSSVQQDNPTIDVLNALGVDATTVGNHEFDQGTTDLVDRVIPRSEHAIIGANVLKDGQPLLDASEVFDVQGVKVAVVGAVTQETSALVSPGGIPGVTFTEPVAAVNAEVARLKALPEADRPDVFVASYHEGAPDATLSYSQQIAGSAVFKRIAEETSPDVDAIFNGHTHQKYTYDAPIPGVAGKNRPILQTGNYGENVGQVKLTFNPDTGEVDSYTQKVVARVSTPDATLLTTYPSLQSVKSIRDAAVAYATQVGDVEKGQITGDITTAYTGNGTTRDDRASESTLGNLVADALLSKVGSEPAGADLALVNPGGLRAELRYASSGAGVDRDGVVTYAELNAVLPFANNLNSVALTGASIKKIFEQQWQRDAGGAVPSRAYLQLGTSKNVSYTFDPTLPEGSRIQSIRIDGEELDPARTYKVATFSFLASGGDNFRGFKEGVNTDTGKVDRDGWIQYFEENSPIDPSYAKHAVQTTGVKKEYAVGGSVSYTLSKLDLTSLGVPATTRVVSKLVWEGGSRTVGTQTVTAGTSAPIAFTLPTDVSGAMRVESTAYAGSLPVGTKAVVPLDVTGAAVSGTVGEPVAYGAPLPVTVSVTGPGEQPTGTVTLKKGDVTVGTGTLADGEVVIQADTTKLGVGTSSVTIVYSGDEDYLTADGTVSAVVDQATTTTTGTAPATETAIDGTADVEVSVTSETETTPTGDVTVSYDGDVIGTATLEDGAATVAADVSSLEVGSNPVTITYAGDANHAESESDATIKVKKGVPTLEVTATGAPYGTGPTINVTTDSAVNGLIFLFKDGESIGMGIVKDGKSTVRLPGTALQPGAHTIDVAYNGSPDFEPTDPQPVDVTVTKAAAGIGIAKFAPSKVVKNKTNAQLVVKVASAGFVPTGPVRVSYQGYSKTVNLSNGQASFTLGKFSSAGSKAVQITYFGSAQTNTTSRVVVVKVVNK